MLRDACLRATKREYGLGLNLFRGPSGAVDRVACLERVCRIAEQVSDL